MRAVEIVLADGSVVRADADSRPDLYWAVRGAGANVGIVTSFDFEVDVVGEIGWAQLAFDASDTAAFLTGWGALVEAAPRDLTAFPHRERSAHRPAAGRLHARRRRLVRSGHDHPSGCSRSPSSLRSCSSPSSSRRIRV